MRRALTMPNEVVYEGVPPLGGHHPYGNSTLATELVAAVNETLAVVS